LSPTTLPATGVPTFTIGDDEMEIGMGIHGEPGVSRGKLESADQIADRLLSAILEELSVGPGTQLAVLVNGSGATPPEELYILYRRVHLQLAKLGANVHRAYVGEYATSLEMAGASLTLLRLDERLIPLLDADASSPFFVQSRA
ncbi:MAG TPA: dihydroxyacetone kinase subunit DhaK, partial [Ktedonobacteraceae bacterium]|nr:dihydroxyacetone kinase subunit DhaK [Ktedonobacteraceae bacterium]